MEVAITRIFFAPDSTSCRTRCAPRNPVPPVIRVVGGTFLTMAACFFVLCFGTICAVRFFGGVFGIYRKLEPQRTQRRTGNSLEIAVCSSDRSKSLSSWMDPPAHAGGTDLISVPSVVNDLK